MKRVRDEKIVLLSRVKCPSLPMDWNQTYTASRAWVGEGDFHNEELHELYSPAYIIRVIRLKKMRLAEHVACAEGEQIYRGFS
jgi:hypothetical protein